jgi:tryptophanase
MKELAKSLLAEPYRIKTVERVRLLDRADREEALAKAAYSIVRLNSSDVFIDLVTDSGTGAMSDEQWAGLMRGDEAYMGSRSFRSFEDAAREVLGYPHVIPTHQGRGAENILMEQLVRPGHVVLCNTHFDTTRAHVQNRGATPLDLMVDSVWDFGADEPFKGNFDLAKLEQALTRFRGRVPFILVTVLNNMACSSPVSMENIREARALADRHAVPLLFDACRFAENAYFIKAREPGYADRSVRDIAREMFSHGDGCWMSAKKDAIVNIGGFLALKDEGLAQRCQERLVLYEGFPSYGGLACRDLEAMAIGLREGTDEAHLEHRVEQTAYLGKLIEAAGVTVSRPVGGSGVFVDVASIYPHLPPERLPSVTLACDLYLEGGVRAGAAPFKLQTLDAQGEIVERRFEFARFALPRRVYTKSHLDYVGEVVRRVKENAAKSRGYRVVYFPEVLGHFFGKFEPVTASLV